MYRDFEDLRDNCPVEIQAEIAIDFHHSDPERLDEIWAVTQDGEFRLSLTQRVTDFWEGVARERGGDAIPEDGLAMEILLDSYNDPEMGYSLYLELHAYCGTEAIGDLCWKVFDDEKLTVDFEKRTASATPERVGRWVEAGGLRCVCEVPEIREL